MIELPQSGYGYTPSTYVRTSEIAAVSTRQRHSMDDRNTTVITLKSGVQLDTSRSPEDICHVLRAEEAGLGEPT